MEQDITIRYGEPDDAQAIVGFMFDMAWETERLELDRSVVHDGVLALMKQPEYGFYVVAASDSGIAGCMMVTYEWSDWRNGVQWWIQSVYTAPEHRRKGVFRNLYAHVKELASQQRNVRGLRLYVDRCNASAKDVYSALGMAQSDYVMYETQL